MPTGGKSHDSNLIFIYTQFLRLFVNNFQSSYAVIYRYLWITFWQSILKNKSCNPILGQPFCTSIAFVRNSYIRISSTGDKQYSMVQTGSILRQIT